MYVTVRANLIVYKRPRDFWIKICCHWCWNIVFVGVIHCCLALINRPTEPGDIDFYAPTASGSWGGSAPECRWSLTYYVSWVVIYGAVLTSGLRNVRWENFINEYGINLLSCLDCFIALITMWILGLQVESIVFSQRLFFFLKLIYFMRFSTSK